jgi:hypothetical protein
VIWAPERLRVHSLCRFVVTRFLRPHDHAAILARRCPRMPEISELLAG